MLYIKTKIRNQRWRRWEDCPDNWRTEWRN